MPRGHAEDAKRALVATLKGLARTYGIPLQLTRDATDAAVRARRKGEGGRGRAPAGRRKVHIAATIVHPFFLPDTGRRTNARERRTPDETPSPP